MKNSKTAKLKDKASKHKLDTSELVAGEAEESDDENKFSFGGKEVAGDDEEGDEEGDDEHVEGLVDDADMNAETLGVDRVLEKHKSVDLAA